MQVLTAEQSKAARNQLGLSQRKVATDSGLPRNILNLFELQRVVPVGDFLDRLRSFYVDLGADLPQAPDAPAGPDVELDPAARAPAFGPDIKPRDGFVVPSDTDEDDVEALLERIATADQEIAALREKTFECKPVEAGFFDGFLFLDDDDQDTPDEPTDHCQADLAKLQLLLARRSCLVEELAGRPTIYAEQGCDEPPATLGDWLGGLFVDVDEDLDAAADFDPELEAA